MDLHSFLFAFSLTLFAGLCTGLGGLFVIKQKNLSPKFLCGSLGFSAGVMIYVSFVEILSKANSSLITELGEKMGGWVTIVSFFGGIGIIALIDSLLPTHSHPHEPKNINSSNITKDNKKSLLRMGLFSAFAISLHNFPEGLATFIGALNDPALGISLAVAIAIHNIPEGISVAAPIYHATKSKKKAFWISFAGGLGEPIGALIGYFLLSHFFTDTLFGVTFALVAGIMVYISLDELLPTAEEYGEHHIVIYSLIGGMFVMALSLGLFL